MEEGQSEWQGEARIGDNSQPLTGPRGYGDMDLQLNTSAEEIHRLQRCIDDLVALLALPAVWSGKECSQIIEILLDVLLRMLRADLIYARVKDPGAGTPVEAIRVAPSCNLKPQEIHEMLGGWFEGNAEELFASTPNRIGGKDISIIPVPLGVHGETGMILVGSSRVDFPGQSESLLLSVAANQASIGLKEAWLLSEQKRTANQLERQVAERTEGLAAANEKLKNSEAALHKALDEIKNSEAKLRQVIDAIPTLAWCNLPDGPNEFLNKGWHEYTGLSREESHGWGWQAAFHPEDLPPLMEKWRKMLVSGESDEIEARLRRHDGAYRWFLIRAQAFRDNSGNIVRWYGTSTDIDDRKRAEQKLRQSESDLRTITDAIRQSIVVLAPDGTTLYANQVALDRTGLTLVEANDHGFFTRVFHPDDTDRLLAERQQGLSHGAPFELESRVRQRNGEYRWQLIQYNPLKDEQGQIIRWYATATDIDDRKQAEARVEQAYLRLAEAQRLSKTGSFITDLLADNHDWSEETFRIFAFDPSTKVTVRMIRDIVHPEDQPTFDAVIARGMTGTDVDFVFRIVLPRSAVKHIRGMARVMTQIGGHPLFIGALQDVTESKIAEEALDKARSELAHVARVTTLNELTASIAHEINQPLSGIITNASTCLRMLNGDPPNIAGARETVQRTLRDGNRASDVITRLRTLFSKKEFTLERMDLNEATRDVIALLLSDLQRNRVVLRSELAEDLPPIVADRIQLQQVTLNLLRNASDAMVAVEDRSRQLLIRTQREGDERVRLSVQDAGVGVNPQDIEKLFEAFYTTKSEGMGIGLSVSRSIIERHHGRLWAEPNDGPGVTFSFSIPCSLEGSSVQAA